MKRNLLSLIFLVIIAQKIGGQDQDRIIQGKLHMKKIIELVRNDYVLQLADLIAYPLERPDPIPNIENKESFIFYYSTLFDECFKQMLLDTSQSFSDIYVDPYEYNVGFLRGYIYLNEKGIITSIYSNSSKENDLKQTLMKETLSMMHPSIKKWKENILTLRSDSLLIRVDLMEDNSLRYISWTSPKKIYNKPDTILFDGIEEFQGTMGGVTYTFLNGNWTYIVDYSALCSQIEDCGYFLEFYEKDIEKKKITMTRIK
jgi:hypothetical protein